MQEVVYELKVGIRYCSDYIPNLLLKKYLHKQGTIGFAREDPRKMVHPDDINKIEKIILHKNYQCIDMQAQYLVLSNKRSIVRVLPKAFTIQRAENIVI